MGLKKFVLTIFLTAFSVSFGMVIFGEAGLVTAFEKSQDKVRLEAEIATIEKRNQDLELKINSIQKNRYDLEYYVRKVANLAAKDEIIFAFD